MSHQAEKSSCELFEKSLCKHSRAAKRGGFKRRASQSGLVLPFLSFFVLFCPFWDFPDFSGIFPDLLGDGPGISRFVPFSLSRPLRAPTRNSPERVCDTIWTFPEKSGKPPVWKPPGLACLNPCNFPPFGNPPKHEFLLSDMSSDIAILSPRYPNVRDTVSRELA